VLGAGERAAGEQPSAETAAEAMQLRRKLLLSERRKAAAQRTAALLAERGLTLPPDLPRTPRSAQRQQQQQRDHQPAAAEMSDQRRKRRRSLVGAAVATAEGVASMPEFAAEVVIPRRVVPESEESPPAKRRRGDVDLEAAEQLIGEVAGMDATSPATTEVQAAGTASTDVAAAMEASAGNAAVTSPDRRVPAPRASRGEARRLVAVADAPVSARPAAASALPVAGGANGSLAVAAPRQAAGPQSNQLPVGAEPEAVTRSSEKLLTALLAAEAAPVTPNVKARAGPMLAVSRPLTGFGDMAAKVRGLTRHWFAIGNDMQGCSVS